ncbi:MAG: 5'-methylthioadenosine/S-adenosylhomocysteine nucleosidase [Desulfobacterales bacterium]|nr:5'-methylthioadenosine/S-adenosylhomocysteine nucleosidase [Desulfobacterales bacterium]
MTEKIPGTDVLLLTAVKDELDVVLKAESDWKHHEDSKGFDYYTRKVVGTGGNEFSVAVARPIDMGGDFAANLATRLVGEIRPRCLSMIGICAGRKKEVFLGDVVVADRVFRYDSGKLKAFREGRERKEDVFQDIRAYNLRPLWIQKAQDFPSDWINTIKAERPLTYNSQEMWLLYALDAFESGEGINPVELADRKLKCPNWKTVLERLEKKSLIQVGNNLKLKSKGKKLVAEHRIRHIDGIPPEPGKPEVHVGPMGTGSQVKQDPDLFPTISRYMRKILAVDMEAAAIGMVAGIENTDSCIIAKAVSDYGDPDKNDHFRSYAIEASYRFLMAFLKENLRDIPVNADHEEISTVGENSRCGSSKSSEEQEEQFEKLLSWLNRLIDGEFRNMMHSLLSVEQQNALPSPVAQIGRGDFLGVMKVYGLCKVEKYLLKKYPDRFSPGNSQKQVETGKKESHIGFNQPGWTVQNVYQAHGDVVVKNDSKEKEK